MGKITAMASKAPLALAAVLFVLGLGGLAYTMLNSQETVASGGRLIVAQRPTAAPTLAIREAGATGAPAELNVTATAVPEATAKPAPEPPAAVAGTTAEAQPTPKPEPEPFSGAFAAGVAADGSAPVGSTPIPPVRVGMIGRDAEDETPTATPSPTPAGDAETEGAESGE